MSNRVHIIKRAFAIAGSGVCANATEVRRALGREGYTAVEQMHITRSLSAQIKQLCQDARTTACPERSAAG